MKDKPTGVIDMTLGETYECSKFEYDKERDKNNLWNDGKQHCFACKNYKESPVDKLFGLGKIKRQYTEADMEAAFNGGGSNAGKLRVSDNKLTLPVLDFKQWLDKHNNGK
jgi:hypothetical protein